MNEIITINTDIAKTFDVDLKQVQAMVTEYQTLSLEPGDKEQYAVCRAALTSCVRVRTGIDKRRKELNDDDQKRIKSRNVNAKDLAAIVAPAEDHLSGLVRGEDGRLEAIEAAKKAEALKEAQDRVVAFAALGVTKFVEETGAMTSEEYDTAIFDATEEWKAEQERLAQEAADRKAEAEKQEKIRLANEAESKRLADIAANQKAEAKAKQDAIDEQNRIAEAKLAADRAEIARQQKELADAKAAIAKAEQDKKDAEEAKLKAEADARAENERLAQEQIDRDAKKKADRERQERLAPDKAKATGWLNSLGISSDMPNISQPEMVEEFDKILRRLSQAVEYSIADVEDL